jgi:heparan-alpha-glucosaminide N-acetyltransferase
MSAAPVSPSGPTSSAAPKPAPTTAPSLAAVGPLPGQRLVSLDTYRGITMFAMASNGIGLLAVAHHFPDSPFWQTIAYQFEHVPWVGCSVWDMIQPSFMFIVGVAMVFSCTSRAARGQSWRRMALHAAWRSVLLILLGIFLRSAYTPRTNFMFTDVLAQIGLGYFFLFLLWTRPPAVQLGVALALLVGDWLLFYAYAVPAADFDYASVGVPADWQHLTGIEAHWDMSTNVATAFDQWWMNLFPRDSVYTNSPGGYQTLNFIPALVTMIFGLLAGGLLKGEQSAWRKFGWLVLAGLVSLGLGWGLAQSGLCPLVKRIWTPSWTLFSTGWVLLALAGFFAVVDILGFRRWTFPFVVVGMNSILIYVMAELMPGWFVSRLHTHFGDNFFTLWGLAPGDYSPLVQGVAVLMIMWLVCYWCYRQKVFIRI